MRREFTIIFERDESGMWVATIAEVPGAFSQGSSKADARANVLDALAELMAARRELALRDRAAGVEVETLPVTI